LALFGHAPFGVGLERRQDRGVGTLDGNAEGLGVEGATVVVSTEADIAE
jgi:hypothetical protein